MKKKLAIIGANASINMLIKKANSLGYETHVFAWECGDPGEKEANYFYPISIDSKEKILDKCSEIGIDGVCSVTSDFAAPVVNYIANKLGLTCNPKETDELARNKYLMRQAFKKAGLYTPNFLLIQTGFSEIELSNLELPVIVKPVDRWSSKGITRVDRWEELNDAVDLAIKESLNKQAIVEEFMDGPEFSAECICFNGEKHILAYTQKETTGSPHYIERGHFQPACLSNLDKSIIEKEIKKGLDALFIANGAAHAEFRILKNGHVGIIEIGARMGGDCIGTDLTPTSTGMDYMKMVIDISCGNSPDFSQVTIPSSVRIKFIIDSKDYNEYIAFKEKNANSIIREGGFDNNYDGDVLDSSTRHGFYIYKV